MKRKTRRTYGAYKNFRSSDDPAIAERITQDELLVKRVMDGEVVPREECGARLIYRGLGSGYHPGVFCENGHIIMLIESRRISPDG